MGEAELRQKYIGRYSNQNTSGAEGKKGKNRMAHLMEREARRAKHGDSHESFSILTHRLSSTHLQCVRISKCPHIRDRLVMRIYASSALAPSLGPRTVFATKMALFLEVQNVLRKFL